MDKQAQFIHSPQERVAIIGTSCSGKITLAHLWHVPHIELDALHWQPNWSSRPLAEFRELTGAAIAAERWVLDGNYSQVRDLVWGRATTVIWLNYPFHVVFWRALTRTTRRVLWQEELYSGNRETFRLAFLSKESILWWVVATYHRRRREYPALFKQPNYAHLKVIELHTPAEVKRLILQR